MSSEYSEEDLEYEDSEDDQDSEDLYLYDDIRSYHGITDIL